MKKRYHTFVRSNAGRRRSLSIRTKRVPSSFPQAQLSVNPRVREARSRRLPERVLVVGIVLLFVDAERRGQRPPPSWSPSVRSRLRISSGGPEIEERETYVGRAQINPGNENTMKL